MIYWLEKISRTDTDKSWSKLRESVKGAKFRIMLEPWANGTTFGVPPDNSVVIVSILLYGSAKRGT